MPEWTNPTEEEVRLALEGWEGRKGLQMEAVTVEWDEESPHGPNWFVTAVFKLPDDEETGLFRARYCASGLVDLEHVRLPADWTARGMMNQLLTDFQAHYRAWGMSTILMKSLTEAGDRFAASAGFKQEDPERPAIWTRQVDPEPETAPAEE